jgi:chromosome segregation ATPase
MTEPIKDCGINFPSNSGRPESHTWPCANAELIAQLRTQIEELTLLLHNNQVRSQAVEEHHGYLLRHNADLREQIAEITEKRDECATVLAAMTERSTELIAQHRQLIGCLERADHVIGAARRFAQPIRDAIAAYDAEKGSTPA